MAIYPGAVVKKVDRYGTKMKARRVNLHTAVSNSTTLFPYFRTAQVCSHFYVREDGTVEQYVDTAFRAAADGQGNPDTISVETWDGYKRLWSVNGDIPPWNHNQVVAMALLLRWIRDTHGIPLELVPDSKKERTGVGYHRQGIDPWRVSGGLVFSKTRGKPCPGDRRVAQVEGIIELARSDTPRDLPRPISRDDTRGYSGVYVKEVQSLLNLVHGAKLLVDGVLGPVTRGVVRDYQKSRGLVVDGDPGPITVGRLRAEAKAKQPTPKAPPTVRGLFPLLVDGRWGPVTTHALQVRLVVPASRVLDTRTVKAMQHVLNVREDGDFGPITRRALQRRLSVRVDGFVGPVTVRALQRRLNAGKL